MSAALDAILADTEAQLEVTIELDSAKRSDGTLKTWYYSSHGRSTGAAETPADTEFPAYLVPGRSLGPLSQSLAEDLLFSGMAENDPGSITLIQPLPESATDQLSQLNDYTFAGYQARIKIGRVTDAYASFERLRTTTCEVEPEVVLVEGGLQAEFRLAGALKRMLEENLIVKRYVGIPTCLQIITGTGKLTAANNAAYNVTNWTLIGRFRTDGVASGYGFGALARRETSSTNRQFQVAIYHVDTAPFSGRLQINFSVAGVSKDLTPGVTAARYDDNAWHALVLAVLDKTRVYLMVDGAVVGTATITGSVDRPSAAIELAVSCADTKLCDWRFLDRFLTEDEARGIAAVRQDGDDLGVVGAWRMDDNAGGSANDYSPTANDATIAGTINVDYSWGPTDLGEPELAGRPMPIVVGEVLNAQAHLIDGVRERYRFNDGPTAAAASGEATLTVRSRGTALTGGGVDYTAPSASADSVVSMTAQEDEPVTLDHRPANPTNHQEFFVSTTARRILEDRTRIAAAVMDTQQSDALRILCPWESGFWSEQEAVAQSALQEVLGQSGLSYYETPTGALFFDYIVPPYAYGPYGEPCLDFRGIAGNHVAWGDIADIPGSLTVAAWFKTILLDQTNSAFTGAEPSVGSMLMVCKSVSGLGSNYSLWFQSAGTANHLGKVGFNTAGATLYSPAGIIEAGAWYFVAGVFDDAAKTQKIYIGKSGGTLIEVASASNSGSQSTGNVPFTIGGDDGVGGVMACAWYSVQHAQVWGVPKTLSELQALMATPPLSSASNLAAYIPGNEGSGAPIEAVSATSGTVVGTVQWAPKLLVNLNDTPSVQLTEFRHAAPAADVIVRYARNRHPMTPADIDTGVSQNNRLDLQREWKDVRLENPDNRTRFKNARKIELDSPITDRESAQRLARSLMTRFGTDRYVGTLSFPSGLAISRQACGLRLGDEIGLVGAIPSQISTARSFRVVAVAPDPLQLSTTIAFWG